MKLVTASDIATDYMQCCTASVRRMAADGRLPKAIRVGRLSRWRREEIEQWIKDGCPHQEEGDGE